MTPHDLAIELVRLLNQQDVDGIAGLLRPDAELFFPRYAPRPVFRGEIELREFFAWLVHALPLHTLAVARITAGATSAVVEFETAGLSRRGHRFDNVGVLVIDVEDGSIAALRVHLDTADLARVLDIPAVA